MIANITIANKTSNPICNRGAMAFIMDFRTTCKPVRRTQIKMVNGPGKPAMSSWLCVEWFPFYSTAESSHVQWLFIQQWPPPIGVIFNHSPSKTRRFSATLSEKLVDRKKLLASLNIKEMGVAHVSFASNQVNKANKWRWSLFIKCLNTCSTL